MQISSIDLSACENAHRQAGAKIVKKDRFTSLPAISNVSFMYSLT